MLLSLTTLVGAALAGERTFAFAYGYGTVPKGGVEVEHYLTMYEKDAGERRYWEHQVELEYGITDRLEGGLYVVGAQWDEEAFAFKKYKGRLRYRLGSQGVWPIDVGLYGEYVGTPGLDSHGFEGKVLLGKDAGPLVTAMDIAYELELEDGAVVHEIEPTAGVGYRVTPAFTLGVEGKFETYFEPDGVEGPYAWAGPSVHLAGEGGKLWWTFAVLTPLTGRTQTEEGFVARSLLALNL